MTVITDWSSAGLDHQIDAPFWERPMTQEYNRSGIEAWPDVSSPGFGVKRPKKKMMRAWTRALLAAAVVAVALFTPPDAHARSRFHFGFGNHSGYDHSRYYGYRYYAPRHHYYGYRRPYYGYRYRSYRGRGYPPPPTNSQPAPSAPTTSPAEQATNCREFTKTIVIDGQEQTAHGTVCRQSDGSWRIVN